MNSAEPPAENLDGWPPVISRFLLRPSNYETGRFRNFMSHGRQWLEEAGSEDSHARALVGAGHRCGTLAQ